MEKLTLPELVEELVELDRALGVTISSCRKLMSYEEDKSASHVPTLARLKGQIDAYGGARGRLANIMKLV